MNTGHYNEHIDHQNDLSDHQIIRRQLGSPFITLQTIIPSWMTSKLGRRLCSVALPPISFCSDCQFPLPQSSILSLNFQMLSLWLVGLGCSEPSQCFQEESTAPSSKNSWLSASSFEPYMIGNFVSCQSSLDPPWALAQAS